MTFLKIYTKYNLTEKEVHTLQVMKACGLTKTFVEAGIDYQKWNEMRNDGILVTVSYSALMNRICKVADFVHE